MFGPARRPMHLGYVVCCVRYENLVFRTRESRDSCGSSLHRLWTWLIIIPLVVIPEVPSHLFRVCDQAKSQHWSNAFSHKDLHYCHQCRAVYGCYTHHAVRTLQFALNSCRGRYRMETAMHLPDSIEKHLIRLLTDRRDRHKEMLVSSYPSTSSSIQPSR
jgi:hypothetical protein